MPSLGPFPLVCVGAPHLYDPNGPPPPVLVGSVNHAKACRLGMSRAESCPSQRQSYHHLHTVSSSCLLPSHFHPPSLLPPPLELCSPSLCHICRCCSVCGRGAGTAYALESRGTARRRRQGALLCVSRLVAFSRTVPVCLFCPLPPPSHLHAAPRKFPDNYVVIDVTLESECSVKC